MHRIPDSIPSRGLPISLNVSYSARPPLLLEQEFSDVRSLVPYFVAAFVLEHRGCQLQVLRESENLILTVGNGCPRCAGHQLVTCRNRLMLSVLRGVLYLTTLLVMNVRHLQRLWLRPSCLDPIRYLHSVWVIHAEFKYTLRV